MGFNRERLLLYAVTDRGSRGLETFLEQIEEALRGGVTMVQLREKELSGEELVREAVLVRELCHRYGVPLIVNDDVDAALLSGADGVHLGLEDAPVSQVRRRCGADFIIGATAKTVEQARAAFVAGADYLGVGAVFPSPTKKNAVRITAEELERICRSVPVPAVAIGGISPENVGELAGGGMDGIAVVSALFGAEDVRRAAAELKERAREVVGQ
ncbi:MAG: thiamine phosphate synthase [Lachnospiraceae bacterium]|nr:thiamine phosphate synthase [Lachnospiraceae bacterium]